MIIIYCGYHSRKSGTNKQSKFPNSGHYIEKYLVEKDLDLTATLNAEMAYSVADFVVIVTPMNVDSTNRNIVATSKSACFIHSTRCRLVA